MLSLWAIMIRVQVSGLFETPQATSSVFTLKILISWDDSSVSWWLNWMSCLPLQLGIFVRCDISFGSCFFFFCFDALQECHMCNLKHYNLSSNLSTRQLWCMSWITGNISSVWSRFILRKCHFKEPPCRISAAGNVEKEGEETLKTSDLPTASHSRRALFKGMPKTPCGFR